MPSPPNLLFRCGVVADVQYADVPDGWDFHRTRRRFYRGSLQSLLSACKTFDEMNVDVVLQLGDFLDGKAKGHEEEALRRVTAPLDALKCPVLHVLGNHEMYLWPMERSSGLLNTPGRRWHYIHEPCPGWRIIVVNCYSFSCMHKPTSETAYRFLEERNHNDVRRNVNWRAGMAGTARRFVPFNGALDEEQLAFLRDSLDFEGNAIILGHLPICPGAAADETLVWNYDEVLEILHGSRAKVVAYLAGHDHEGGYKRDKRGVHHVTFQSPMTCRNFGQETAHGVLSVCDGVIRLQGFGTVPDMELEC